MRILKFVFPLMLALGFTAGAYAADKPAPADERPTNQAGTLTGVLHLPEKEAPKGAVASLHQGGDAKGGGEVVFFLFADGSTGRKLKDLAEKGVTATVSGDITKDGYHITSITGVTRK